MEKDLPFVGWEGSEEKLWYKESGSDSGNPIFLRVGVVKIVEFFAFGLWNGSL